MRIEVYGEIVLSDYEPPPESFRTELLSGLRRRPKAVPSKFFYDEEGSRLFEQICELEEYYLTRTETEILSSNIEEIAAFCGRRCALVELGSGNSRKTRLLLEHLDGPVAYIPVDISRTDLIRAAKQLNGDYFPLEILPICADYTRPLRLPAPANAAERTVIFFPGSTIGNFHPAEVKVFLRRIANWCNPGDGLLVGVDLEKSTETVHAAYNDAKRVTAAFNLNLLRRANAELGANFDLAQFHHEAVYNRGDHRVEMRLVSNCRQHITIGDTKISFEKGEQLTTEYSYKYRLQEFYDLALDAGWQAEQTWMDEHRWFAVVYFELRGQTRLFDGFQDQNGAAVFSS